MLALQINRQQANSQSPKATLRAYVECLSPEQQREFVETALQLIGTRPVESEAEVAASYHQPLRGWARITSH